MDSQFSFGYIAFEVLRGHQEQCSVSSGKGRLFVPSIRLLADVLFGRTFPTLHSPPPPPPPENLGMIQ